MLKVFAKRQKEGESVERGRGGRGGGTRRGRREKGEWK